MGAFMSYMMANWSRRSRVDQSRRRLRHLVAMVRAVADDAEVRAGTAGAVRDESFSTWLRLLRNEALRGQEALDATEAAAVVAGSARRFLAGLRDLFGRSDEMDRLEEAIEELQCLAEPGGALDRLSTVFGRWSPAARGTDMDIDGEASGGAESVVAVASAGLRPAPGAKRKRACSGSGVDPGSTSHGVVDAGERRKRRRRRSRVIMIRRSVPREWHWRWQGCDAASGGRRGGGARPSLGSITQDSPYIEHATDVQAI